MLVRTLISFCLMALCVAIHAVGITLLVRRIARSPGLAAGFLQQTWSLVRVAAWIITFHCLEIFLWAVLYRFSLSFPDLESAFYFSSVTYTTVGFGDLVLPEKWRLIGGIEALTGILMCGWSTGFFFSVVARMQNGRDDNPA